MTEKTRHLIDLFVVMAIILIGVPATLHFGIKPLTTSLFFFVLPAAYLLARKPRPLKRIFVGALVIGVLMGFLFNFLASFNKAWQEVPGMLYFDYKVFGVVPLDEPIWFFFWALFIIVFYEHFLERERIDTLSHNLKYMLVPPVIAWAAVLIIFATNPSTLQFRYAYFIVVVPVFIPLVYVFLKDPNLIPKFIKIGVFFFFLYLTFELIAVKTGQWYFPGDYVGVVELADIRFPFEELFFWMILSSSAVLSLYEWGVDDEK